MIYTAWHEQVNWQENTDFKQQQVRQDGLSVSREEPARQEERQHKGREELPQQDQTEAKLITPTPADDVFEEGDGREMWLQHLLQPLL